ncbi:hypothetical protein HRbin29_01189 [bacterium HR29]|jgi:hypothetical protein|nr:hypothetical protein HRbin29_01189 [bacterium HR29]
MDPDRRRSAPQPRVSIVPETQGFAIYVDKELVLAVPDELDAHHWAKHVVECVNAGETRAAVIRQQLPRVCEAARRHNLHTGYYPSEP